MGYERLWVIRVRYWIWWTPEGMGLLGNMGYQRYGLWEFLLYIVIDLGVHFILSRQ